MLVTPLLSIAGKAKRFEMVRAHVNFTEIAEDSLLCVSTGALERTCLVHVGGNIGLFFLLF